MAVVLNFVRSGMIKRAYVVVVGAFLSLTVGCEPPSRQHMCDNEALDNLEITTRKEEYGEVGLVRERTYRGRKQIMWDQTLDGVRVRMFMVNGNVVLVEVDEDGDGIFEEFKVFDTETGDFEWFTRSVEDVVRPVPSERLEDWKIKKRAADAAAKDVFDSLGIEIH